MHKLFFMLALTASLSLPAIASVSVNIGINLPSYPALQRIQGYPVYYVPRLHANYFFYDGLYWVYVPDGWYVSPWYNGPWEAVDIDSVPLFVLRIPVRYYGYPPDTFRHWTTTAPPRWEAVWGSDWARRHQGWQRWNRASVPPLAPPPRYQQRYTRDNYPTDARRLELIQQHYNYAPRDTRVRQQWKAHVGDVMKQQHSQPNRSREAQTQLVRPHETKSNDRHASSHGDAPIKRYSPPQRAPASQAAHPHAQADSSRPGPVAARERTEQRGSPPSSRQEHGSRPDNPGRADGKGDTRADNKSKKGPDYDSDKRH